MAIKQLPTQLANQIAAGEVVERPSSVVKELVENSLDAGADHIEIDIEKGGHKRIRIKDNGCGIVKDELGLALAPHSTSKIFTLDDLENIASLGFRGEALASISSVSRLTISSKPEKQTEAWAARVSGRDMALEILPTAHPNGTTIDVVDIFYNTPARRKFLRAEKTEFQHIEDIVKRIALSRPKASFILLHNGKVIKRWPMAKADCENQRVAQVCGQQFSKEASKTQLTYEGITLTAWVGGLSLMRSATDMQYCFVNGRAMRDKLLLHAIRQAYETVYESIEQPAYVLFIELNPNDVDVNVHPAKHEVRFQHARHVHDLVCKAIQDALRECDQPTQIATASHQPNHDYIQPLQARAGLESVASAPGQKAGTAFQASGSRFTTHRHVAEGSPSKQAVEHYQTLMSSSLPSPQRFSVVGSKGLLKIENQSIQWIPAKLCLHKWLNETFTSASVSQPLLMPVSVMFDDPLDPKLKRKLHRNLIEKCFEPFFEITFIGSKCILKKVPSALRQLAWGRIFPAALASLERLDSQNSGDMKNVLVNAFEHSDDAVQMALNWCASLPHDKQTETLSCAVTTKSIEEFVDWIER